MIAQEINSIDPSQEHTCQIYPKDGMILAVPQRLQGDSMVPPS